MHRCYAVTPHAGVWIETRIVDNKEPITDVTPHAGVWIETLYASANAVIFWSLPMRECGLKQ